MTVEVVAMVYKNLAFARFIRAELGGLPRRIVGNDPTEQVAALCDDVYSDPRPTDWYLSRVYRCWNYCVQSSKASHVCLVNSDMAFSPGWLDALVAAIDGKTLPVSRLVEQSVVQRAGEHAIPADFGRDPEEFPKEAWLGFADTVRSSEKLPGGCYMPILIDREAFLRVGGYPEGNMVRPNSGPDILVAGAMPVRSVNGAWMTPKGDRFFSGDDYFVRKMSAIGFQHTTVFDSVVYHMQEGEMRSCSSDTTRRTTPVVAARAMAPVSTRN